MTGSPRLVFGHYFGGSARSWKPLLGALGDTFETRAANLPGFGGTAAPEVLTLDAYAEEFRGLGGDGPWIAVGHSMSGKIALAAAARGGTENLKALILIAPSPPTPEPMTEENRGKTLADFGDRAAARVHIEKIAPGTLSPPVFDRCVEDEVDVAQSVWTWWLERGSRDDISTATARIDIPVLVITGDKDVVMGTDTPRLVAGSLPNAALQVVPGGGHLVPLEQPGAVAALMHAFIAGLAEPRGGE